MTSPRVLFAAALAGSMLAVVPAQAATYTLQASSGNGPAYVEAFRTDMGTLNSITFDNTYFARLYYQYPSELGEPVVTVTGTLGYTEIGLADVSGSYQSRYVNPQNVEIVLRGGVKTTFTDNLDQYTGDGYLYLAGIPNISAMIDGRSAQPGDFSTPGGGGGTFKVTFDYTPAIPEPATWALMLTGFALTGYALRRRRIVFASA